MTGGVSGELVIPGSLVDAEHPERDKVVDLRVETSLMLKGPWVTSGNLANPWESGFTKDW